MKKNLFLSTAALMLSALLFSCNDKDDATSPDYKPEFSSAEQLSYTEGTEFAVYALEFKGTDVTLKLDLAVAPEEVPLAAGKYQIAGTLSTKGNAVVAFHKGSAGDIAAKSGSVTVAVSEDEYTFTFALVMADGVALDAAFTGTVKNIQQPDPDEPDPYQETFATAEQKSYTAGEAFATFEIVFTNQHSTLNASFGAALDELPLAAGDYEVAEKVAGKNQVTVTYQNIENQSVTAAQGKVTVTFDAEKETYKFAFDMTMSDERAFSGSYRGAVEGIEMPGEVYNETFTKAEQKNFTAGETFDTYEIAFTSDNSTDLAVSLTTSPGAETLTGEYFIAADGLAAADQATALYGIAMGVTADAVSGTITVEYDAETEEYAFSFDLALEEKATLTGTFTGKIEKETPSEEGYVANFMSCSIVGTGTEATYKTYAFRWFGMSFPVSPQLDAEFATALDAESYAPGTYTVVEGVPAAADQVGEITYTDNQGNTVTGVSGTIVIEAASSEDGWPTFTFDMVMSNGRTLTGTYNSRIL